jgi:ubiquinone biosynthesis protein
MIGFVFSSFRLMRAAWTLARHDAMFPVEYKQAMPPAARLLGQLARLIAIRDRAANPGERLARALESLGPSYIKFGQVLATRADVVGADFARGLSRLQDRLAPFGTEKAKETLIAEFGAGAMDLFESFGEPVAAASIAQVHNAVTSDGREVAVKILRPDIEKRIKRDIAALRLGAHLAERLYPVTRRMEPKAFVEVVARSLSLELDFRLEAASASELQEAAFTAENFNIPEVDWSRTSKRVLTTEWIDAIPMTQMDRVEAAGVDKIKLAADITDAFLTTALDHGVFHADMHAGNLFVEPDGTLWAVDFGIMGRLGPEERQYLAQILYGFLQRDYPGAAQAHFDAGYVPERFSKSDFASALRAVAEPIFGKKSDEVPMSRVLMQLFEITDLFDMHLQPQLVLLQKTMVQAEGVCRTLSESHNMWTASGPSVERFMRRELGPEARVRGVISDVEKIREALLTMPATLERLSQMELTEAPSSGSRTPRWVMILAGIGLIAIGAIAGGFAISWFGVGAISG